MSERVNDRVWVGVGTRIIDCERQLSNLYLLLNLVQSDSYFSLSLSLLFSLSLSFSQLAVGPVAIVSLLTGTLIAKWQPDYATNTQGAADTAAQASLCTGIVRYSSTYICIFLCFFLL